jgi:diguanylate cyclase (GGDEF)-like protein
MILNHEDSRVLPHDAAAVDPDRNLPAGAADVIDISHCEREPIHIPGAIQPHGALIVARIDSQRITHVSANLMAILGQPAEAALGQALDSVIGQAACRALNAAPPNEASAAETRAGKMYASTGPNGATLEMRAFRSDGRICVDIVPAAPEPWLALPVTTLQSVLESFKQATSTQQLCELVVRGLKAITGFDRVIAYKFSEEGHGQVIAECREPAMDPYLGLRYPAGDLPAQARRLTMRQRLGAIADTHYVAEPVLTDPALPDEPPIDLTFSALRSVSPIHREYLRNMKVSACLTVGLVYGSPPDGQHLWGMVLCHHLTPRIVHPDLRAIVDVIGEIVSLLLRGLTEAEVNAQKLSRMAMLRTLTEALAAPVPLQDALAAAQTDLLSLVDAGGALLRLSGTLVCLGTTPEPAAAEQALALLMIRSCGEILAEDDLALRHPSLAGCTADGSGVLLLPLGGGDAILWFRPELSRTVVWGGDPTAHGGVDVAAGLLSPRASFAAWKEIVSGRSEPWSEVDLALARTLRDEIESEVARRARVALAQIRHYDPLTGLPTRTLLRERIAELGREPGASAVLLFIDIGQTKEINETLGLAAGDAVLVEVARRILVELGPEDLAARLNGDEFAVLCRGVQRDAAVRLGGRIALAIEAPFDIGGRVCNIVASLGVEVAEQSDGMDLVHAADRAMHSAKVTIEALRKAEAQRQKMEALGRMMGGVAHEINNMLQPVALLVQDIIDQELVIGEGRPHLDIVLDCTMKARQIIGDLLAFSRPTTRAVELHDPVALLHDSLRLVRQAIPQFITLHVRVDGAPPPVSINRTTFVQILLNLATNAAAAMNGLGELTIVLDDEASAAAEGSSRARSPVVRLRVIDTGCGMSRATLDRAFEPFFTTKAVGQGTGLGLPVVYGLVKEMGGTIALASEPNRGTTVTVVIPGHNGGGEHGEHSGN